MKRRLFYLKSDSDSLDSVFVLSEDDGKFWEGWVMTVGWHEKPSLHWATYKADDPELVEVEGIMRGTHTSPLAAAKANHDRAVSTINQMMDAGEVTRG